MSFAHLHTHTQYSLLDGSNKIKDYVAKVKRLGMSACAITDHGVMYGVIDFYRECKAAGINPVLGCEVYVAPQSRFDRENVKGEDRYYHLILLAENDEGYANLMKVVSVGFVDGFYYKPRVDFETLKKYHQGLICLSACLAGEVPRLIRKGDYEGAKETALRYADCFGKENYFLEMQDHGLPEQQNVNQALMRMSKETGIGLVVTNDCHYTEAEDAKSHDILLCIQTRTTVDDPDRMRYEGGQYYVKSEEEMREVFPYAPEAVENTQKIADRCHVEIEFGNTKLPHFDTPEGYDSESYLEKLCDEGLRRRYPEDHEKHRPQLDFELSVIKNMGYVDYFLIVWDFINYAKKKGIPVGPGRGSAAGSLVSYTMGITDIDPVRYALIFERFLNPERVSMPDIDVDFCYERRGEVIDYVVEKYGKDCVTQIVTYGTLKAKGVIRDVGRALNFPYAYVDSIAKMIPDELGITIDRALSMNPDLKKRYDTEEDVKKIIDMSVHLEGLPRQAGMHAAGVVISQRPMDEFVPLARAKEGQIVTQFPMTTIEELGLLKMDFLGLRTLTVIHDAVEMAEKKAGRKISVDDLDYADPEVFKLISSGACEGVFQLESAGMKSFMKELKPNSLEDVIAGISLYRPGPMDFIPAYLKGKNHPASVTYECPQLEPILSPTYGCIVYQEQVMQIVRDLAGYSLGRSDMVRRAMSKKKMDVMERERKRFVYGDEKEKIKGCINNGISEQVANHIFDEMIDFAKYAFNKSHAASYAVVAYQTAWLRTYYPTEFFAALMTSVINDTTKIAGYINVCKGLGMEVLPPDVNEGEGRFTASEGAIRYGMYALRSVGTAAVDAIVSERKENGPYTSLQDFIKRNGDGVVNKKAIEALILAGAMDGFPNNRREMSLSFAGIVDAAAKEKKSTVSGQMTLFDIAGDEDKDTLGSQIPTLSEFDEQTLLANEKEVLGIYLSGHPLEEHRALLSRIVTAGSADFAAREEGGQREGLNDGARVVIGGIVTDKKIHFTKNNEPMAFVTVEDMTGTVETVVFPRVFEKYKDLLEIDSKIFLTGRVSVREERDASLLVSEIYAFDGLPSQIWIRFADRSAYEEKKEALEELLKQSEGGDGITIFLEDKKQKKNMPFRWNVDGNEEFLERLGQLAGPENIRSVPRPIKP